MGVPLPPPPLKRVVHTFSVCHGQRDYYGSRKLGDVMLSPQHLPHQLTATPTNHTPVPAFGLHSPNLPPSGQTTGVLDEIHIVGS